MMATAVLVDGAFFIKRVRTLAPEALRHDPYQVAKAIHKMALDHLLPPSKSRTTQAGQSPRRRRRELYRIFFYDCPPLQKKAHHPVTKRAVDCSKTPEAVFRLALHDELRKQRKVALRLGQLAEQDAQWRLTETAIERILKGESASFSIAESDVIYTARQKGVDMKIGLDIASIAYKKLADQIVLVAGDSDFVPASKLARREGIDFILDPMWNRIRPDLYEHIDGLRTTCIWKPASRA